LALVATRLLRAHLLGVGPTDALTYASVGLLLSLVTLAAFYFPARRATADRGPIGGLQNMVTTITVAAVCDRRLSGAQRRYGSCRHYIL
jgi:multisubunit Na+/H+ antiporter MnhB subunit